MRELTLTDLIRENKKDMAHVINMGWFSNPQFSIICAYDLSEETVNAVGEGISDAIAEIRTVHQIVYPNMSEVIEGIYAESSPDKALEHGVIIKALFDFCPGQDHLIIKPKYDKLRPTAVVTSHLGFVGHRAAANTYLGVLQLPVGNLSPNEARRVAMHEAGHVLTLSPMHHDVLGNNKSSAPYRVAGYEDQQCVMNSDPCPGDDYVCNRCVAVGRANWQEIRDLTGVNMLK